MSQLLIQVEVIYTSLIHDADIRTCIPMVNIGFLLPAWYGEKTGWDNTHCSSCAFAHNIIMAKIQEVGKSDSGKVSQGSPHALYGAFRTN